ncbi:MAG: hypothetical protein KBA86_05515 [Bacteroidales bacterium]|nr:hypothetical protein [Bacteroidales bacterium]
MKEYVVNNFKVINYQYAVEQLSTCIDLEVCSLKAMMFEKYPSISPYTYCANNPMKYVDPTGEDWIEREVEGRKEVYYDRKVKSQADVDKKYGKDTGVRHLADGSKVGNGQYTVYNDHKENKYGVVKDADGNVVNNDKTIIYGKNFTLFAGVTDKSVDATTLYNNLFNSSYIGPYNPKNYIGDPNYDYLPTWSPTEMAAYRHDVAYDVTGAKGSFDAFTNTSHQVLSADNRLVFDCDRIKRDPSVSKKERMRASAISEFFSTVKYYKVKWSR